MKLIRFRKTDTICPGVILPDGPKLDCSAFGEDYNEHFFASDGPARLARWLKENADSCPVVEENVELAPPIARPSKLICIGLNYKKHAEETGNDLPTEPVIFMKATSAITGPNDGLTLPEGSKKTDWEVELGVVIGKKASYVTESEASEHIAGYLLHNDYSERAFQIEHGGQWVKGKSADTFAPIGPFLATPDEVGDPHSLNLWLKVNGKVMQKSTTADMIFNIPFIISYLSRYMTLVPGDIISTGTPEGVGMGQNRFLKAGDVVELGIDKLGEARQVVRARNSSSTDS